MRGRVFPLDQAAIHSRNGKMSWNGSDLEKPKDKPARPSRRVNVFVLFFLATVIVICALALWSFLSHSDSANEADASKRGVRPATSMQPAAPKSKAPPSMSAEPPANAVPRRMEDGVEVVSSTTTTNSSGAVIEKLLLANGKKMMKVHPPKPIFENPSDQVIALAVSVKPGESMPPLPDISNLDREFAQSLLSPIVINDSDSDEVTELKAKVMEVRAYLVGEVKNGGSVMDALLAHQAEMEKIADNRLVAIQELQKLQSEGDLEMAAEFARQVNESFKARGIPEIPMPGDKQRSEKK